MGAKKHGSFPKKKKNDARTENYSVAPFRLSNTDTHSLSRLSKDLLARSVMWGNIAKPRHRLWMACHKLFNGFYVSMCEVLYDATLPSQGPCVPTVFQRKPRQDLEIQRDVTLPTPGTSFSFTPQFGISLFSCFSSPPFSPVALCVFNGIFSPKNNIFAISPQILFQVSCSRTSGCTVIFTEAHLFLFNSLRTLEQRELKGCVMVFIKVCTTIWCTCSTQTFFYPQGTTNGIKYIYTDGKIR